MAQKDEAGKFSWVEFDLGFHHSLSWIPLALGQMCILSLLGAPITISAQRMYKKSIFVFILELLNRESEDTFFALKRGDAKEN